MWQCKSNFTTFKITDFWANDLIRMSQLYHLWKEEVMLAEIVKGHYELKYEKC